MSNTEFIVIPTSELAEKVTDNKMCSRCGGLMECKRYMPHHKLFQCPCCGAVRRFDHEVGDRV